VVPIFVGGQKSAASNYRPVSLYLIPTCNCTVGIRSINQQKHTSHQKCLKNVINQFYLPRKKISHHYIASSKILNDQIYQANISAYSSLSPHTKIE